VVGRAEDLRVGQIVQLATQSSQMSISRAFYQYNIALLNKPISFLDNIMTMYNGFSQSEERGSVKSICVRALRKKARLARLYGRNDSDDDDSLVLGI
jgi:hypothetical protein